MYCFVLFANEWQNRKTICLDCILSDVSISLCVQMLRTSEATPWALSALLHWTRLIIRDVHMAQCYNSTYCTLHNSYTDLYNNLVSKYHEATPSWGHHLQDSVRKHFIWIAFIIASAALFWLWSTKIPGQKQWFTHFIQIATVMKLSSNLSNYWAKIG